MNSHDSAPRARFTRIDQSSAEDWRIVLQHDEQHLQALPERLLQMLTRMGEGAQPYAINRLQHCLQTATRAERAGADEEMIVAALLHDIGDELALFDHAQFAAAILKPYVTPRTHWIIQQHDVYHGHYSWQHLGLDPDARERFRGHRWFNACEAFCFDWDCPSFDPDYDTLPLQHFEPMLRRLFARSPYSLAEHVPE